jgi:hypothetical protein
MTGVAATGLFPYDPSCDRLGLALATENLRKVFCFNENKKWRGYSSAIQTLVEKKG